VSEEDVIPIEEADIGSLLDNATVMAPAMCIGANINVGVNENLVTDEVVATVEFLLLVPSVDGTDELAIMPIIMTEELAEQLGLNNPEDSQ
jgi:hypothetical protein|tara:strand:+ start:152 stop:424 length:273 start_codon:yes stop_codon:yes gene_type:complete